LLDVDNQNADNAGPLNEICNLGSTFTVKCGDGDDTVHLSSQSGTYIKFGSKVFLYGGTGDDLFENTVFNQFSINGNFEDCEKDNGVPMA
jgi:hypothetical protein